MSFASDIAKAIGAVTPPVTKVRRKGHRGSSRITYAPRPHPHTNAAHAAAEVFAHAAWKAHRDAVVKEHKRQRTAKRKAHEARALAAAKGVTLRPLDIAALLGGSDITDLNTGKPVNPLSTLPLPKPTTKPSGDALKAAKEIASYAAEGAARGAEHLHATGYRGRYSNAALLKTPPAKGAAFVLNQTLRPIHGIAGGADAALTHKNVLKAAEKGLLHNKGPLFSDVLKHAGVKNKTFRGVAGTVLDIGLDPTTYVTLGGSGATKVGAKLTAKAAEAEGTRVGLRAHVPLTDITKDVGTHVKAPKVVSRAAKRVRETRPVQGMGEALAPDFRPKHISPESHRIVRTAQRHERAAEGVAQRAAVKHARAIKAAVPKIAEQHAITDAIEANTVHTLPSHLKPVATKLEAQFGKEFEAKNVRGLLDHPFAPKSEADAQRYFPHTNRVQFERGGSRTGRGTIKVAAERGRQIRKPLSEMRTEAPHVFEEDLSKIAPHSALKTASKSALHDLWQKVASTGRKVTPETDIHLGDGELVYEVAPRGVRPLANQHGEPDLKAMKDVVDGKVKGDFVVLHEKTVKTVEDSLARAGGKGRTFPGMVFDRTQGYWKLAAISTPAYHARNLIGDSINAYLGDATAKSFKQSFRGMKALHAREALRGSEQAFRGGSKLQKAQKLLSKEIKLGKAGKTTMGHEIALAEKEGAIRTGQAGHDVRELLGGDPKKLGRIRAVSEYREDFPRFATYLAARKRGLSPSAAAEWSLKHHFDYGDLTSFERTFARRAFPFYTFFARNTRLQATKLIQRPGKFATVAKVLSESAKAAGYSDYETYVQQLPEYNQRGLPLPIRVGGKVFNVFVSPPLTDLQQLTDIANPQDLLLNDIGQRLTFFKAIPELVANYSTFFRGPIQNDGSPLVPAPDALGDAPAGLRSLLGVKRYRDKRTGKMIWGWPAKVDYVARLLPQSGAFVGALTSVKGSRGQTGAQQLFGLATGLRVVQNRPLDNEVNQLYAKRVKLQNTLDAMHQRMGKDSRGFYPKTKATERIKGQIKQLDARIGHLRSLRGDPREELSPTQRSKGGSSFYNTAPSTGGSSFYKSP